MPKLQVAIFAAAIALLGATSAIADGYYEGPKRYGYAPDPQVIEAPEDGYVVYSRTEVKIRYRGAPGYGYGAAYLGGPANLWRQRDVAFDAIFTEDKRIIYDAGRAAQTRAAVEYYGPKAYYRPPAAIVDPVVDPAGGCGTFRYWNGAGCVDARFYSRYKNPYKWEYIRE